MKTKRWSGSGISILLSFSLWFFSSLLYGTAFAAPVDFPKKEITIIVNYGPGGIRDILARGVGSTMSKYLGVPVVVMNMPGAGGARGMISLYNSAPDGYTIGVGMFTDILDQVFENREYDNKKFTYIGTAMDSPSFFWVKSDSPFRLFKDFKTFGKPVRYSTFGLLASNTVLAMILANREGWPLAIVGGYQGSATALLALIRGEVEFSTSAWGVAKQYVEAGQMRPILILDEKRFSEFPEISTVGEIGYPELGTFSKNIVWLMGPAGIPKDRAQILEDALMKTLKDPEFIKWAKGAGVDIGLMNGEETTKMVFSLFDVLEKYKGDVEKYLKKK